MHDPAQTETRKEASRKGGKARANKARAAKLIPDPLSSDELAGWLSLLFTNVMAGRIEAKVGTACASIARVLMDLHAQEELEARLTALERQAGIRRIG